MPILWKLVRVAFLIVVLFPLSAFAARGLARRGHLQAPAALPPANCEISGVVTDAGTGRPIAGAQVSVFAVSYSGVTGGAPVAVAGSPCDRCDISGAPRYQALTNARGRFIIQKVAPGQYQVRATAKGYAGQYYHVNERYMALNAFFLRPGQNRDHIRIRLPRQAVLAGRVVDENGQPVISAYVQLLRYGPPGAKRKNLQRLTATVTDDRGDYRLFGLPPGRYSIEARYEPGFDLSSLGPGDVAERFIDPRVSLKTFSPAFYYPGVTDPRQAKPIDVSAGQVRSGLDISVRPRAPAGGTRAHPGRFQASRTGHCQVSGVVTSAATGRPVDHVWVYLGPANGAVQPPISMTSTAADGRFDFHAVSCSFADLPVLAWKDGFAETYHRPAENVYPPGPGGPFPPQPKIDHVNLSLVPAGVIAGRITGAHGKPAACVRVVLVSPSYLGSQRWTHPQRETVTDDRGRFRFYQLAAGRYYVAAQIQPSSVVATQTGASLPGTATASSGTGFALPYVYYPGAATAGNAREVRVMPGAQVKGIDFSVKPETTYSISGVVKGPALQAVNRGLRVILAQARSPYGLPLPVHQSPLDASGKFQIDKVAPGSYVLWATAFFHGRQYAAWVPLTLGRASITGIALDPHPGWTVTGRLRVEGRPPQGSVYEISAKPQDDPVYAVTGSGRAVPPGGSFELRGLFPGSYLIRVEALPTKPTRWIPGHGLPPLRRPPNLYIKSLSFGAQDMRASLLKVPRQEPTGKLDLTVDWDGAQVEGTVVNSRGEPAGSAYIVLIPENRSPLAWWQVKSAQPYLHGRFLIPAVPPGRYRLFAWEDVSGVPWLDPGFLNSQWKKGMVLALSAGEIKSVKLHVLAVPVPTARRNR